MVESAEVEFPSHFLCPISMDLMRDPVTTDSGITYDRDSIETWLFSANNTTCPVTKHNLSDTNLTPNLTLRRLIHGWCAHHSIPSPEPPLDRPRIVRLLADAAASPETHLLQCLQTLKPLALEGPRARRFLEQAGVAEFLVAMLIKRNNPSFETREEARESELGSFDHEVSPHHNHIDIGTDGDIALSILYHLGPTEGGLKRIVSGDNGEFVSSLVNVLRHGKCQSRAYAILLLKSFFEAADPVRLVGADRQVFAEAVRVLKDRISFQATKAALKLLVELSPWGRNRVKAVEAGAVHALVELLLLLQLSPSGDGGGAGAGERRSSELVLAALEQLCGCADGRAELVGHAAGVAAVAKRILRVSQVGSDKAVRILGWVCRYSGTGRVLQEMLQVGAVAKLCLVAQLELSNKSGMKTRERSREILRLHSWVWRNSPCVPPHLLPAFPS